MRGFTTASVIVLVIVVAVVGIAAVLLAKTVQNAQSINKKAQNIAEVGTGINEDTDSVVQLTRTNKLATSILGSADPLERQLDGIVGTAKSINGLATSINSTAGAINGSATEINGTATDINSSAGDINSAATSINNSAGSIDSSAGAINQRARTINASAGSINTSANSIDDLAGSILGTARAIDTDVRLINQNLDVSLNIVRGVKADTGNILLQATSALDTAACIDRKLVGSLGNNGDCKGTAAAAAKNKDALKLLPSGARTKDGFKRLLLDKKRLQVPGAPGVDLNVPDPDLKAPNPVADPDAGPIPGLAIPGTGAAPQGGAGSQPVNIIDRLFPALRGQAGSGK
jgi:type II secretory pathway pseudopilin PulG